MADRIAISIEHQIAIAIRHKRLNRVNIVAIIVCAVEVHTDLAGQRALHLNDANLQHDLVIGVDIEKVDDLTAAGVTRRHHHTAFTASSRCTARRRLNDKVLRKLNRALGFRQACYAACQNDRTIRGFSGDRSIRKQACIKICKTGQVLLDADLQVQKLVAVNIKEKRVRFTCAHAAENHALRCAHHGVSDIRVCDDDISGRDGQFYNG